MGMEGTFIDGLIITVLHDLARVRDGDAVAHMTDHSRVMVRGTFIPIGGMNRDKCTPHPAQKHEITRTHIGTEASQRPQFLP